MVCFLIKIYKSLVEGDFVNNSILYLVTSTSCSFLGKIANAKNHQFQLMRTPERIDGFPERTSKDPVTIKEMVI
jgi:hypothetical protein